MRRWLFVCMMILAVCMAGSAWASGGGYMSPDGTVIAAFDSVDCGDLVTTDKGAYSPCATDGLLSYTYILTGAHELTAAFNVAEPVATQSFDAYTGEVRKYRLNGGDLAAAFGRPDGDGSPQMTMRC